MDWSYLLASTYIQTFGPRGEKCFTKYNAEAIQKLKSTRNLHEINFLHDLHENTQENSTTFNQDDQSPDYKNPTLIKI